MDAAGSIATSRHEIVPPCPLLETIKTSTRLVSQTAYLPAANPDQALVVVVKRAAEGDLELAGGRASLSTRRLTATKSTYHSEDVQKLQSALHAKAKAEVGYRFYALKRRSAVKTFWPMAMRRCRGNKGAPRVDGRPAHNFFS
jgi:hypothetical protein